ncbi:MAG: hypothetical protein HY721_34050 [Planctomycetes bacterium]|nr:hypothetical protein [Planctomycetota bacterium]
MRRSTSRPGTLLTCLAASLASSGASAADPTFVRGDVNLDGAVTFSDVGFYLDAIYFQGPLPRCFDAADANDSGQLEIQGPMDWERLRDWLFRSAAEPPAPFPLPGVDPTKDNLGCADPAVKPPAPAKGYSMAWEHDRYLYRGSKDEELFLEVTTAGPITGFSLACRVDRRFLTNLRVDFEGTIVPSAVRKDLLASPYFRARVTQSASPLHDLLLVGAIFLDDPSGLAPLGAGVPQRIPFPATEKALKGARILRIRADVLPNAPVTGSSAGVILPVDPGDLTPGLGGVRHGVLSQVILSGASYSELPDFSYMGILADEGEFLRADANGDACRDLSDAVHTLSFLFLGGPAPPCPDASDANDDGRVDISDASYTLGYLFTGGPPPPTAPLVDPSFCWYDVRDDSLGPCVYECRSCRR